MGGMMMVFNQSLEQKQIDETNAKIAVIQKTLLDYRRAFNRIPCPADITQDMDATSSNNYGVEAANSGTCTGGAPASNFSIASSSFTGNTTNASATVTSVSSTAGLAIGTLVTGTGIPANTYIASIDSSTQITLNSNATATNSGITISYNTVVGGMVPTKTLRLPDEYGIDGWGRRIMYVVDVNVTANEAFAYMPVTDSSTNRITVNNASGTARITSAAYLLISYGKNGHGAYPRIGGITRLSNYISSDADELTNCHCTTAGISGTFSASFVQKPLFLGQFDDIVSYSTRSDLRSFSE